MNAAILAGLIWGGAAVAFLGVIGLLACGMASMRARGMGEQAARAVMQKVVVWNLAAMGVSVLGLAALVTGLVLR
jgi:D-alanyl-lipoteichoic acid acyltransferase DltB (MBOAT superfamily)